MHQQSLLGALPIVVARHGCSFEFHTCMSGHPLKLFSNTQRIVASARGPNKCKAKTLMSHTTLNRRRKRVKGGLCKLATNKQSAGDEWNNFPLLHELG